ncbi:hypothetical protein ACIQTT_05610 [Microbacterium sp. NPDC090225]|uniref:hypothetical protein n=1 Tax=Microbacterium sp. NPDC090225 TaxID=3364207 RepID=UPI00382F042E
MRSESGYFVAVMSTRYPAATLALALVAAAVSGCAPAPEPSPTPTPAFASEEEAFAAAEEVYRAYNEAGNARIAGESSPDPQDFLIGEALEADIDGVRFLQEEGLFLSGVSALTSFTGVDVADLSGDPTVRARICLNGRELRVLNSNGMDVTPQDRNEVVAQLVTFVRVDDQLMITTESDAPAEEC